MTYKLWQVVAFSGTAAIAGVWLGCWIGNLEIEYLKSECSDLRRIISRLTDRKDL